MGEVLPETERDGGNTCRIDGPAPPAERIVVSVLSFTVDMFIREVL